MRTKRQTTTPPRRRVRGDRAKNGIFTPLPRAVTDYIAVCCEDDDFKALLETIGREDRYDERIDAFIESCEFEAGVFLVAHLGQNDRDPDAPHYLKHPANGRVYVATEHLLKRGDLLACTEEGVPTNTSYIAPAVVNDNRLVIETTEQVRANLQQLLAMFDQKPIDASEVVATFAGLDARSRSLLLHQYRNYGNTRSQVRKHLLKNRGWSDDSVVRFKSEFRRCVVDALRFLPVRDGRPKNEALYVLAAAIYKSLCALGIKPTTYTGNAHSKDLTMPRSNGGPFFEVMKIVQSMAVRHAKQNHLSVRLTKIPTDIRNLIPRNSSNSLP